MGRIKIIDDLSGIDPDAVYTVPEAGQVLGVDPSTLNTAIRGGRLEFEQFPRTGYGKQWQRGVRGSALIEFARENNELSKEQTAAPGRALSGVEDARRMRKGWKWYALPSVARDMHFTATKMNYGYRVASDGAVRCKKN